MAGILKGLFKGLKKDKPISYDEAKELARHENLTVRRELASRRDIKPEILYYMAEDPSPEVRRQIAANEITPRHADLVLARDGDESVRTDLAGKIAKLAPGLTDDEQDKVHKMTYEALEILARDQAVMVRQIISETLKDVANAPPKVIRRLARDVEMVVCGPVLEYSPVLSDEDLLEIIANDPVYGALSAISRRSGVAEPLADAIVAANDPDAIAQLLSNTSAQIREETLDHVIGLAPDFDSWHKPLVQRPTLPPGAAARLARFVADNLLDILTERKDIDLATAEEVKAVVRRRLESGDLTGKGEKKKKKKENDSNENEVWRSSTPGVSPSAFAKELKQAGKLDESAVSGALQAGENEFVKAALSALSGMRPAVVDKIVEIQSAKGIVAMTWKAGLSVELAEQLQKKLARIHPKEILRASGGKGFPLTKDEMKWQIDFLNGF
ncbi:MAG: hypothetical protein A3G18_05410 [Rhodospirillales bacterium RIFCSPLOWO2_12_FULL_58_28]|nr:MAG: hypothetical protein A3H92_05725 [Rhodospirillales bacterium RIFCSPLOWO2_02_FULL_58_16]OHC79393.1 MAG: hypothetical protein A3G18_05410 [Rhodospirillales bacterium RIFCSPLOWO2_12_FULL_58_28]